jgi:FMN-dependent NADH-azoreductase
MAAIRSFTSKGMTMKLLHIDSSILAANSVSRQLTAQIVAQWQASHPGTTVDYLDLATQRPATCRWTRWAFACLPALRN